MKVNHQGNESVIDDATTALIGSDATSTIRIVRPGISRRHAVISHDDTGWRIEDAGSRNGTFLNGQRIQVLAIEQPVTLYLGHPSDGESVSLTPVVTDGSSSKQEPRPTDSGEPEAFDLPPMPPAAAVAAGSSVARTEVQPRQQKATAAKERRATTAPTAASASDVEVAQLTAAIRDQISAIKGLTWSVWAMIAATAALIVLTLFVGILSN